VEADAAEEGELDDPRFNRPGAFFVFPSLDLQSAKVQFWFSL